MARTNKLINLVFSDIIRKNDIDAFLNVDDELSLTQSGMLQTYKNMYAEITNKIKNELILLANLEELIVQLRCITHAPLDFNLSITNNSIYVKLLFYREDRIIKDIRIIAGNVATYGDDLNALAKNQDFIDMFTEKAKTAMKKEINKTVNKLEKKLENSYIYI